jgi:outer membrane protein
MNIINNFSSIKGIKFFPLASIMLLMLSVFLPWTLHAEAPVSLKLKDAITYALGANQQARIAKLNVENAQYKMDEMWSQALPTISGSASLTYNPLLQQSALPNIFGPNPNPDETILVSFGQHWNSNLGVTLNQTVFDNSVFIGMKAARTTQEFYVLNQQLTEEQIIEGVARQYYQILVQRQQIAVLDSNLMNTLQVQKVLQGLYDNGLAKKIDLDRVAVNLSNISSQRQQLINTVALYENELKFLMGMPINTPILIMDEEVIVPETLMIPDQFPLQIETRTEYNVLQRQKELLAFQKESFKSEYYPTLSLSANYLYQGIGNEIPLFSGQSQGVNWFGAASVGLNLRVPIVDGGFTRSKVRQADVSLRKLDQEIDQTAMIQLNNSLITLKSQEENIKLAEEIYFNTQNNYQNGLATLTDLLAAEISWMQSQNNYTTALLNYRMAEIQILKSKGQLHTLLN